MVKWLVLAISLSLLTGCSTTSRVLGYTVNYLCNLEEAEAIVVKSVADTITRPNQVRIKCYHKQNELIPEDWNEE